ncbi:NAD(P)H-binding protein [Arthrobacter ginkgonis]|uniref:NAD(P)H-binding protein n=1 Tax=Arthrobacter ginkgonis TaxID=1630594 RepID=A0ABP7DLF3_9MICC
MNKKIGTVTVFGATGYTGTSIVGELLARSASVTGVARDVSLPSPKKEDRLELVAGSLDDDDFRQEVTRGRDAVVLAVPARLENGQELAGLVPQLLREAEADGYRLGIVGGAGTLQVQAGGPTFMDHADFPAAARGNAESHSRLLKALQDSRSEAEWFYLSPPARYGLRFPGKKESRYRLGKDVLVADEAGISTISSEDYAAAFVDELFHGRHIRTRFSVGY